MSRGAFLAILADGRLPAQAAGARLTLELDFPPIALSYANVVMTRSGAAQIGGVFRVELAPSRTEGEPPVRIRGSGKL